MKTIFFLVFFLIWIFVIVSFFTAARMDDEDEDPVPAPQKEDETEYDFFYRD